VPDTKHLFGFVWKNHPGIYDRINGDKNYDHQQPPEQVNASNPQLAFSNVTNYETYGYPSSNHPGGVNVAFCGGSIRFMGDSIDPVIYGQIMTSNSRKSNLVSASGNIADRKLPQPADRIFHKPGAFELPVCRKIHSPGSAGVFFCATAVCRDVLRIDPAEPGAD